MDALRNIVGSVPDWLKRLDELGTQIDQRQAELAAISGGSSTRSIKNKGSTESLKLKEPIDAHPVVPSTPKAGDNSNTAAEPTKKDEQKEPNEPPSPVGSGTPSQLQRQTQQAVAKAQARARAHVKKRQRSGSMISADNVPSQYRSRTMIIVYYDSYVQSFFEELVKFVSASRNLMRKARMAAKVAQIRRLAEMEAPQEDEDGGELKPGPVDADDDSQEPLPSLRYMSTRRLGAAGARASAARFGRGPPGNMLLGENDKDAYEDIDKGLELVQSLCEQAAHQFLRDGDCMEEVAKIQKQLAQTKVQADKELERVQREEPELLKDGLDATKARTLRPASMRREWTSTRTKGSLMPSPMKLEPDGEIEVDDKLEAESPALVPAAAAVANKTIEPKPSLPSTIEVDDGPLAVDEDEGFEEMEAAPPKLQYRSTRGMRRPMQA